MGEVLIKALLHAMAGVEYHLAADDADMVVVAHSVAKLIAEHDHAPVDDLRWRRLVARLHELERRMPARIYRPTAAEHLVNVYLKEAARDLRAEQVEARP